MHYLIQLYSNERIMNGIAACIKFIFVLILSHADMFNAEDIDCI